MDLIDSHSHFDASEFDADRDAALARARSAGVLTQIVPAVTAAGWSKLRDLCATKTGLHPAYGLHPAFLADHRVAHLDALANWLEHEKPVAVGECGLDFFIEGLNLDFQRRLFRRQLELAAELNLPLVLHARRAVDEVTAALRRVGGLRGVVHSFSGSAEQANQLWKLGFCLGFGGPITYARANRLRSIVASMPLEFLLLETDSPDQPIASHRGERNEPARLRDVLTTVAQLRGENEEHVAEITSANARRLFRLPPDSSLS